MHRIPSWPVLGLDALLRRMQGIRAFSDDPRCLIRVAREVNDRVRVLSDGVVVARGERIMELHLWNEQLPPIPPAGADLRWGRETASRLEVSLRLLADELERSPGRPAAALRARLVLSDRRRLRLWSRLMRHQGFDVFEPAGPRGPWARARRMGEDLLASALVWAFNPAAWQGRLLGRERLACWISRERFVDRYGSARRCANATETARPGVTGGSTTRTEALPCSR